MKIFVGHSSNFDFKNKLYSVLRTSVLNEQHEILLPMEGPIEEITRDMLKSANLLVVDVSLPSLGAGIEMGWADAFGIPIIAICEKGNNPSFSIDNVITERIVYDNPDDLIEKLQLALQKHQG